MIELRDVLSLLINPLKMKFTCFMCYKQSNDVLNIYENSIYMEGPSNQTIMLASLFKEMFPIQKIFLQNACQLCLNLILNIYTHLRRKQYIEGRLQTITNHIRMKLDSHSNLKNTDNIIIDLTNEKHDFREEISTMEEYLNINFKDSTATKETIFNNVKEICPICYKVTGNLKHHLRVHRKRKRKMYTCDECEYNTKCKTTLEGHINSKHLRCRPYICACSKRFYTKSALAEHTKTHTHQKDVICEICGDTFHYKKSLNNHLKLHSNEKLFECLVCNQRFVNKSRVNDHMKRKHGEKREVCHVCCKKFVLKKELTRHMKLAHKDLFNL